MLNDKLTVRPDASLREALKRLDEGAERILFVVDGRGTLLGTLTDGDARRALLNGYDLGSGISGAYNSSPISFHAGEDYAAAAREAFVKFSITHIPIVDAEGIIVDCLRPAGAEEGEAHDRGGKLDLPVIIMAGGKGIRMAPFTKVLPKPLIPIGDKTIVELIMEGFARYGVRDFRLTVNYKGEMIRAYFQGAEHEYNIEFVLEKEYFGTAGSIKLVERLHNTFIVSNCDILVKTDFAEVVAFHEKNRAALTIISSIQHYKIPYGVVEFGSGGRVSSIREKPEFSFSVNTGVYILDKRCLDFIPDSTVFDMTDLINALIGAGEGVYTYPVNEKDYIDIGQWEEYRSAVKALA